MRNLNTLKLAAFVAVAASAALVNQAGATAITGTAANGLLLSLGADSGVSSTAGVVTGWLDETTGDQVVSSSSGTPTLITNFATPNGTHNAVQFNADGGLILNDAGTLGSTAALQTISTFVVVQLNATQLSRIFITDFSGNGSSGWASGVDDFANNTVKWYRGTGGGQQDGSSLVLANGTAYLVSTSTNSSGSDVKGSSDGSTFSDDHTASNGINYNAQDQTVSIGELQNYGQDLDGDLAEVLVYNNAATGYSEAAVDSYLMRQVFHSRTEQSRFARPRRPCSPTPPAAGLSQTNRDLFKAGTP